MRSMVVLAALAALGWWMFGSSSYSRVVDRPPAEVAAALQDIDVRKAPGAPGTDPTRSAGVVPSFAVASAPDRVELIVSANNQVATRMIAHLQPLDGGKRTKVTAEVVRGPAPDDYVAPAFRSTGTTLGLFALVLEDELDKLVFPTTKWTSRCDEIMRKFEEHGERNFPRGDPQSMSEGFGNTAKFAMRLAALDKELKAGGCPTNRNNGGFTRVSSQVK